MYVDGDQWTKRDLAEFINQLDDKCLMWTVVWFGPLVGYRMDQLHPQLINTFTYARLNVLEQAATELAQQYKIK